MAGRPKTMAKRVVALMQQAETLAAQVDRTIPSQYREHPDEDDMICQAWRRVWKASEEAGDHLDDLADLLCEKAGIARAVPDAPDADDEPDDSIEPTEAECPADSSAADDSPECPGSEHPEPASAESGS